jgi:SAM-dependent methyltransferase
MIDHRGSKRAARISRSRDTDDDGFYRAFEEEFRGAQALVRSRVEVYLPFIEPLKRLIQNPSGVDLGCGRGEWLELLREHGFQACGVDIDEGMLAGSREKNVNVKRKDAIEFLQAVPGASKAIVSGLHIAEHLLFSDLRRLVQEAFRVLEPGGLLILETPNPENIKVSSLSFYNDPTHRHPLPPNLLSYLPKYYGFVRVKTIRLQESAELLTSETISLGNVLGGASPDYAVIAQKPCNDAAAKLFDTAFEMELGISDRTLTERFDQRLAAHEERAAALEARVDAVSDNRLALEVSLEHLRRQNARVQAELARTQEELAASERRVKSLLSTEQTLTLLNAELARVYWSRSWRITAPLRSAKRLRFFPDAAVKKWPRRGSSAASR